jgi:hypothetical protein
VAYGDDAQIVKSSCAKRYGQPARTEVRLSRVDGIAEDMPQSAFQDWLAANGSLAQVKAAGAWLAKRGARGSSPDLFDKARNTLNQKGPGGNG